MVKGASFHAAGLLALAMLGPTAGPAWGNSELCVDCLQVRVGTPVVVRGPFPDELDAAFTALRLSDGSFRAFTANGATYAVDGATLWDMAGPRRTVLEPGAPGSISDCGRWLTSTMRLGDSVLGLVHQERDCDYNAGRTGKSMAISRSFDDGLTWTEPETIITGRDEPQPNATTGEGDCTMIDGHDGYLYAYCLRNSDWRTVVARASASEPTEWYKYYEGGWTEPGLGGRATEVGFIGTSAGYLLEPGWVATIATDPWFGGVRLSLSTDKVTFVSLDEPLITIDGSDWNRPADTDLAAYATVVNPDNGSNAVEWRFLLSYVYVPPGKGFESRYLVHQYVWMSQADAPVPVQAGMALTRWSDPTGPSYVTSTGPLTGDRLGYQRDTVVAYMLTRAPEGVSSVKFSECSSNWPGYLDHILAEDGSCANGDYAWERSAGWLFAEEQDGTVPVYRCLDEAGRTHFASNAPDCEGLGRKEFLLGYGLAP